MCACLAHAHSQSQDSLQLRSTATGAARWLLRIALLSVESDICESVVFKLTAVSETSPTGSYAENEVFSLSECVHVY
jgi:hypothetical protein